MSVPFYNLMQLFTSGKKSSIGNIIWLHVDRLYYIAQSDKSYAIHSHGNFISLSKVATARIDWSLYPGYLFVGSPLHFQQTVF